MKTMNNKAVFVDTVSLVSAQEARRSTFELDLSSITKDFHNGNWYETHHFVDESKSKKRAREWSVDILLLRQTWRNFQDKHNFFNIYLDEWHHKWCKQTNKQTKRGRVWTQATQAVEVRNVFINLWSSQLAQHAAMSLNIKRNTLETPAPTSCTVHIYLI